MALTWKRAGDAVDGPGARQGGVGGDVLEEHLRELAGGVVRHVPVHAAAVRHLLQSAVSGTSTRIGVIRKLKGGKIFSFSFVAKRTIKNRRLHALQFGSSVATPELFAEINFKSFG